MIRPLLGGVIKSSVANDRPRVGALAEAEPVHVVQQVDRGPAAQNLVAVGNHFGQFAGPHGDVVEGHPVGQRHVEDHAADGRLDQRARLGVFALQPAAGGQLDPDAGVRVDARRANRPIALRRASEKIIPSPLRPGGSGMVM